MSKHIVAFFLIAVLYPACRARSADLAADAAVADRVEARLLGPGGAGQAEALEAGGLAVAGDLAADAACLAGGLAFLAPLGDVPMGGFTNAGGGATCAQAPSWWAARGVTDGAAPAGDFAAAVQGQVKWIARQAAAELGAWLAPAGGAGPAVSDLLASFSLTNNFRAVTLGQLKNAAAPFHDRLAALGLATNCPWAGRPADSALANVGQVKALFAFDLSRDSDGDGMPDGWEAARGLNPGLDDAAGDADGDGVPNRQEYLRGTDPGDALSKNRIVYADADAGSAGCDGYFQTVLPGGGGPKATVQQAVDVAVSGDTLEVRGEAAFADAVVAPGGKKLVLRPVGHVRF